MLGHNGDRDCYRWFVMFQLDEPNHPPLPIYTWKGTLEALDEKIKEGPATEDRKKMMEDAMGEPRIIPIPG